MITDEMLQAAAGEVAACMDRNLSAHPEHLFSPRFRRKMNRLIFKTDHPIQHTLTTCAAILALALTFFATLLTLSPTVRAAVLGWLKHPFNTGTTYSYEGQPPASRYDYTLTNLPEGYELAETLEMEDGTVMIYHSSEGKTLRFRYSYGKEDMMLFLYTQQYEHVSVPVGNESADVYIPHDDAESSVVVWTDSQTDVLLLISYPGNEEELIALAEGVKILEKN